MLKRLLCSCKRFTAIQDYDMCFICVQPLTHWLSATVSPDNDDNDNNKDGDGDADAEDSPSS